MEAKTLCSSRKHDGSRCEVAPLANSEFCFFHDPSKAAERRAAQALGGQGNRMKTLDEQFPDMKIETGGDRIAVVGTSINLVLKGQIDPRVAHAVACLLNIAIRQAQQNELEERIKHLEALHEKPITRASER
jgi:hypothetical protein